MENWPIYLKNLTLDHMYNAKRLSQIMKYWETMMKHWLLHTSTYFTFLGPRLNPSPFLETTVKIPSISVTDPFLDKILLIGICMQSPVWTMWPMRTFCPTKPARPTLFRCGYFCSCFVKFPLQGWILVLFIFLFCSNRHFILLKSDAVFCSFGAQTNRLWYPAWIVWQVPDVLWGPG